MKGSRDDGRRARRKGAFVTAGLALALVLAVSVSAATVPTKKTNPRQTLKQLRQIKDLAGTKHFWTRSARPGKVRGKKVGVQANRFRTVNLNAARLRAVLARAPREFTVAARRRPLVVSLPAPNGAFQRFAIAQSAIMSPGLAKRHPEIKTYRGVGLTDPTATIHADLSPLGFHASVRSSHGAWYIDPYFIGRTPSVYASYYGRDARDANAAFVERESHSRRALGGQGLLPRLRHRHAATAPASPRTAPSASRSATRRRTPPRGP